MKHFEALFHRLEETTSTREKIEALVNYLTVASAEDKVWMIALFSGRRPKRTVSTKNLRTWAAEAADIPSWLFEESYHVVGDLSETIALLLPPPAQETERSLADWMGILQAMDGLEEVAKRKQVLEAWDGLNPAGRFIFNKLVTGGFRLGVSQKLMVKALAKFTEREENEIALQLMGDWSPQTTPFQELLFGGSADSARSRPYPFHLAYALEAMADLKGEPRDWMAEYKWDGIRGQLILRQGQVFLWSRGEELITDKFPELAAMGAMLPEGTVLDGEILPFREGKLLPFQHLQTRIGRKKLSAAILRDCPVVFRAYDLLEWAGKDIRTLPFQERRERLESITAFSDDQLPLQLSPLLPFSQLEDLEELRSQSTAYASEGLMLKHRLSVYSTGRKRGEWWKWKVDPYTIDAILIYAQAGHGRRANLYTDFTFAVHASPGTLLPFTKAYSGLTDREFVEINQWIKRNTVERFGPVRQVNPELVFEIAFEGIQESRRHKSGIALRFPRMLRWRRDKPASEANTLEDLKALLLKTS